LGTSVDTPIGKVKVIRHNVISNRVTIRLENGSEVEKQVGELTESNAT
jgi:hypothetical protein